jgi:hypothetical protein
MFKIIKDHPKYSITSDGTIKKKGFILTPTKDKSGYYFVVLNENKKQCSRRIHKLVALTYIENPNNYEIVNHKNNIKSDNRVENLEWINYRKTEEENEWKIIPNYPTYRVSVEGQIKNIKTGKILSPCINANGYSFVNLYGNDKKQHNCNIHNIIAKTFIDNPHKYPIVNHKNSNRLDNRIENLEWASYTENNLHAYRQGKKPTKQRICQIDDNGNIVKIHDSLKEMKEYLGITYIKTLSNIKSKKIHGFYWKKEEPYVYDTPLITNPNSNILCYSYIPEFPNYEITEYGEVLNLTTKIFLRPEISSGYKRVCITHISGKRVHKSIHSLVMSAFGEYKEGVINHIDGNRLNNHISNLEIISQKENIQHALKIGRIKTRPVCQFDKNFNFINYYISCREAERKTNIKLSTIIYVCKRVNFTAGSFIWRYAQDCEKIGDVYKFKS